MLISSGCDYCITYDVGMTCGAVVMPITCRQALAADSVVSVIYYVDDQFNGRGKSTFDQGNRLYALVPRPGTICAAGYCLLSA